jgi:hypothetical protein
MPNEVEDRAEELVQRGECQLGLGLDPTCPQHPHRARLLQRVLEQRRLADARLATDDQRAAARGPGAGDQALDSGRLGLSAEKHLPILTPPRWTG